MKFKVLVSLLLIVLTSCSDFTMCYYADDFGETGNRDTVNVFVTEQACYYNQNLSWNDEDQSLTVRKCLESTRIQGAFNSFNDNLDNFLTEIFGSEESTSIKSSLSSIVQNNTCETIDTNISSNIKNDSEDVKEAKRRIFGDICLKYCTDLCMNDSSADVSKWVKASLKEEGGFLGIKITENSYVNISVAGTVSLASANNSKRGEYNEVGGQDIDYNFVASPTNSFNLNLQYRNDVATEFDGISNLKNRTILEVKNIENTLVDTSITGTDKNSLKQKYRFQEIPYKYLTCLVNEKNTSGFNTATCDFSFSNLNNVTNSLKSSLNSFYNKNETEVFDGDYYLYDSSNLNDVTHMATSTTTGLLEPVIATQNILELSSDGSSILYSDYDSVVAGYVWNNNNKDFTIQTDYSSKIAIRYIGNTDANCNIKAYSDNEYILIANDDTYKLSTVANPADNANYTNYKFTAATSTTNNNKWNVLKIGGDTNSQSSNVEIVFNQYSVPNRRITSNITLSLDENSDSACSHGLLIKLIPLKDYVAKNTGLLFFYIPNSPNSTNAKKIKYTLINQNLIANSINNLEDQSPILKEFYDYTELYSFFGLNSNYENYSVGLLSSDQISLLDENSYNSILSNAIFVREGQVIRLDYSNWFTIDGLETINKDIISVSSVEADLQVALNVLIK